MSAIPQDSAISLIRSESFSRPSPVSGPPADREVKSATVRLAKLRAQYVRRFTPLPAISCLTSLVCNSNTGDGSVTDSFSAHSNGRLVKPKDRPYFRKAFAPLKRITRACSSSALRPTSEIVSYCHLPHTAMKHRLPSTISKAIKHH